MGLWRRLCSLFMRRSEDPDRADLRAAVQELRHATEVFRNEAEAFRSSRLVGDAPLSKRELAKRLRISRSHTLLPAIADGQVRTIKLGNEERVPVSEYLRLREEGFAKPKAMRSRKKQAVADSPPADTQAAIEMLNKMKY